MKKIFAILFVLSTASFAQTQQISCRARVTIHDYEVSIDHATLAMEVKTDTGSIYRGNAHYFYSASRDTDTYFLNSGFQNAIEVSKDRSGNQAIALCLAANECYRCR